MKIEDVPQGQDPAFEGGTKICYAVNPLGQIVPVRSSGWQTESVVKDIAWQVIERELATCRARVLIGQASALEYFMKARQMDVALLAQNMGFLTWRVRWHLRPKVWAKINARILQRYATCLEVPAHRLQNVSGLEGENELSTKEFAHHQAAHCESGVTSNLLRYADIPISEAMAFGIGSGLFFIHLPMAKVMGLPLTSYRSFPGGIFKKTCRRLKIPFGYETFRKPSHGARALEQHLDAQRPVGLRSNIYWLPYIPRPFRFQFNAHNLVVYGRGEPEQYLVSDPILEAISVCPASALNKARFSKGILAPKGLIFYPRAPAVPLNLPMAQAIEQGIRETVHRMLFAPVSFVGVKGIRYLSRQMRRWPSRLPDLATQKLYMANVVRMQEEIGTGGAGFRFLYAAFLQEAGESLGQPTLLEAAKQMTEVGNVWREFATLAAKFCKDRLEQPYEVLPDLLLKIADREEAIYRNLRRNYL